MHDQTCPTRRRLSVWHDYAGLSGRCGEADWRARSHSLLVDCPHGALRHDWPWVQNPQARRPSHRCSASRCTWSVKSVVNVGAGSGSYEPAGCDVTPIEPSELMVAQRDPTLAPATIGRAESLPLADDSVDAAMTVLSLHHWEDQEAGLAEMLRVARQRIVILTLDPVVSGQMWLMADYLTEVAALDHEIFPRPDEIARRVGGRDGGGCQCPLTARTDFSSRSGPIRSGCSIQRRGQRQVALPACPTMSTNASSPMSAGIWKVVHGTKGTDTFARSRATTRGFALLWPTSSADASGKLPGVRTSRHATGRIVTQARA